ncbi:hypothetical protein RND81_09G234900 [Saponaria officinalis]|uniref:Pentatricopeptide repeat-containing protein n=1 Tax=Saponaria officinalis TaxID=3572 RepID=A0AAW1IRJ7_SAPOF
MADNGCSPNERTYNTIIKGFLNANDVTKALDYLDIMRSQGLAADVNTSSSFLDLLTNPHVNDANKALLQKYFLEHHASSVGFLTVLTARFDQPFFTVEFFWFRLLF